MRITMVALLALGACGGGGDDGVGDDGGGDDGTTACSETADTCTGETICVGAACEAAFGRVYAITNVALAVPTTDPTGAEWDLGGGAPDLFLVIDVDGTVAATTATVQDEFSAAFAGPYNAQLIAGSTLELTAYDEDVSDDDLAYVCSAAPITAELLRGRDLGCASGGSSLTFHIAPR